MASRKQYETQFLLGAKVQSSVGKSFGNVQKHLKNSQKSARNANKAFSKTGSALKKLGAAAIAYVGINAVKNKLNECTEAAKAQIEVETKLETVLKQRTNATDKQVKSILKLTAVQQQLGVIGDEVQIAGAQQLSTFVNSTKSVETLLPAMNNLLAQQKGLNASQGDAVNIGNLMGKVLQGQTGALTRVGITFTKAQEQVLKYGTESERAAMLAKVITDNVGEMNKALAETDQGIIQQKVNALGDMKEVIGKKILPLQAKFAKFFTKQIPKIQKITLKFIDKIERGFDVVSSAYNKVRPYMDKFKDKIASCSPIIANISDKINWLKDIGITAFNNIRKAIDENRPTIEKVRKLITNIAEKVQNNLSKAFEAAKPVIEWLINDGLPIAVDFLAEIVDKAADVYNFINDNWPKIEPILLGIIGALAIYKGSILAATLVTKGISIATTIAAGATTAFGAVLAFITSPIGIAVIAIGALIAIGIAVYKNWDTVKVGFINAIDSIKNAAATVAGFFSSSFSAAYEAVVCAFQGIGQFFKGVFDGVVGIFKSSVNGWIKIINFLIDKVNKFKVDIPDWVPKIGGKSFGINIPEIPMLAKGTNYFRGGAAIVGEKGPELVNMRRGSQVLSNSKLMKLLGGLRTASKSRAEKLYNTFKTINNNQFFNIQYSPQYIIKGNADEDDIKNANEQAYDEFERKFEYLVNRKKRLKFS